MGCCVCTKSRLGSAPEPNSVDAFTQTLLLRYQMRLAVCGEGRCRAKTRVSGSRIDATKVVDVAVCSMARQTRLSCPGGDICSSNRKRK